MLRARTRSKAKSRRSRQNNLFAAADACTARPGTDRTDECHSPSVQRGKISGSQSDCPASNDEPQPHVRDAFGFTMRKPVPVKPSVKSRVAPRKYGTLSSSIK